jgi:CheY-like chemotaxis protein
VNAKDAIPKGGRFLLQLSDVNTGVDGIDTIDDITIIPGTYLKLEAVDNGEGISTDILKNIFEPFFTTKGLGKGTGLGLATVYGVVKQHKGYIFVDSTLGEGTTFTIYLPISNAVASKENEEIPGTLPGGNETILVVEDEPNVLSLIIEILTPLGYKVQGASNGEDAMLFSRDNKFDLLLTDVVMPGISGLELAEQIAEWHSDIKTIYMSGYTDDIINHHGLIDPDITLLNKPIRPAKLASTIRNVLDGKNKQLDL